MRRIEIPQCSSLLPHRGVCYRSGCKHGTQRAVKRREFITLLGSAAVAWPLAARAQQGERVRTIGILASQPLPPIQRFARKLRDYGYIEGQNLRLVSRFVEARDD